MKGFEIRTSTNKVIRFEYYLQDAPFTLKAFADILPFTKTFFHARLSGQEIWINNVSPLDIIQENSSVFTEPSEIVIGPSKPNIVKASNCLGIYYCEGRGVDACNILAKVIDEDVKKFFELGDSIWRNGSKELTYLNSE